MNLINFKFMKENIKKSFGIIAMLLILIPIFSGLILYLSNNSSYNDSIEFMSMVMISVPAMIGMYVIPVVISISLFSFVFQKKSVDFICSLPLKRSTIFCTNTLIGLVLFGLIFIITAILMFVIDLMLSAIFIPGSMLIYYFITWFITYMFVFVISNLSITLTGNKIVAIVLTILIAFLPGYMSDYYNSKLYEVKYSYSWYDRENNYKQEYNENFYNIKDSMPEETNHVIPYKYARVVSTLMFNYQESISTDDLQNIYSTGSIIWETVMIGIYFVAGLILFNRRKMEVAENTFLSAKVHNIVRCIVMFPIAIGFLSIMEQAGSTAGIVILTVFATIYFMYDLITRRSLQGFQKSLIYLCVLLVISFVFNFSTNIIQENKGNEIIKEDKVSSVGIALGVHSKAIEYRIENKEIISYVFSCDKYKSSYDKNMQIYIYINLDNGKTYRYLCYVDKNIYDDIYSLLEKEEGYIKAYKNTFIDNIYAITDSQFNLLSVSNIEKYIVEGLAVQTLEDLIKAEQIYYSRTPEVIELRHYEHGKEYVSAININTSKELQKYIIEENNSRYINKIKGKNIVNESSVTLYTTNRYNYQSIYDLSDKIVEYINRNIKSDIKDIELNELFAIKIYYKTETYVVYLSDETKFNNFMVENGAEESTYYKEDYEVPLTEKMDLM